ncbi:winged helix-turn-helix domain-containing protein [Aeromonas veronii]
MEAMEAMLNYRDSVEIDSHHIAVHVEISEQKLRHDMDDCLRCSFCMQCPHWGEIKQQWVERGYFTETLFERKEFHSNKVHRALCLFCSNFNVTISKKDIFSYVWHNSRCQSPNSVSVMVYDLRILLRGQNVDIVNVRGIGYRLEPRRSGR